jgi:hypothetical protein
MPIKVSKNTVFPGLDQLKDNLVSGVKDAMSATVIQTTAEIKGRQRSNEFWDNESGNAIDSIAGDVDDSSVIISGSVGFEDGRPNEKDAPDYYTGRDHEYAKYIADREQLSFVGSIQAALIRNWNQAIKNVGKSIGISGSSRAEYSKGK